MGDERTPRTGVRTSATHTTPPPELPHIWQNSLGRSVAEYALRTARRQSEGFKWRSVARQVHPAGPSLTTWSADERPGVADRLRSNRVERRLSRAREPRQPQLSGTRRGPRARHGWRMGGALMRHNSARSPREVASTSALKTISRFHVKHRVHCLAAVAGLHQSRPVPHPNSSLIHPAGHDGATWRGEVASPIAGRKFTPHQMDGTVRCAQVHPPPESPSTLPPGNSPTPT